MNLETPLSEETVRSLCIGDIAYLNGIVYTARDAAHMRALKIIEEGEQLPFDLKNAALYHCGPIVRKVGRDGIEWKVLAAGPTTSARMNSLEPTFICHTGIRAIIGKGGMSVETVEAMQRCGCVYFAITGGAAVTTANKIARVVDVAWLDLGMAEAMWAFEVRDFGPLVVAIDAHGKSLYDDVERTVVENIVKARKILGFRS